MYKNVLIATDGSDLSAVAVRHGISLAKTLAAKVTAVNTSEPFHWFDVNMVADAEAAYAEGVSRLAAQALAVLRKLGLSDSTDHVNPHGGAIALGHPLGMSGARLAMTAVNALETLGGKRAVATMCIGVGQGIAALIERV